MADQPGTDAQTARDADRLRALEQRLDNLTRDQRPATPGADKFHQANHAWRMVTELVAGLAIGFAVGYGLDWLMGTAPIMLVIFIILGFAAGVRTMLRTAAEMGNPPPDAGANDKTPDAGPGEDERD